MCSPSRRPTSLDRAERSLAGSQRRVDPASYEPGAFAHEGEELRLDVDRLLTRAAQRPEPVTIGGEDRVGDERADVEQARDRAAREGLLRIGRVVRPALDYEAADALGPRQRDVLRDVEQLARVVREDDVLRVLDEARLGEVGRAEPGELGEPAEQG